MAVDVVVYDKVGKESEKIQDVLYALYPQQTITDAAIASFADGSDGIPVKELVVGVEPVQAGTGDPSPDNVRPISEWTGAEIVDTANAQQWDEEWEIGGYNPTTGAKENNQNAIRSKGFITVSPNTEFYGFFPGTARIFEYDKNYTFVDSFTTNRSAFKTGSDIHYLTFNIGGITAYANNISINYPATDTAYHAYAGGSQISVTFPSSAGTVYGGTLTVNPDRTGQLVVDRESIDMASITDWNIDRDAKRVYKVRSDIAPASDSTVIADGLICNRFQSVTVNQIYANVEGVAISTGSALQFRINGLTDVANVTLAMVNEYFSNNSTSVVAKLATPITYPLTASEIDGILKTLYGTNNIWADCGSIQKLAYRADLGKYIDSHITTAVANALNA